MVESTPKTTSSVHDVNEEKPPFGSRFLTDETDVWSQNAWDHVPPPDDQADTIAASIAKQKSAPVPDEEKGKYHDRPARHWDTFYKNNTNNFFRDRKWLHNEFPELVAAAEPDAGKMTICEIGCGAGNSVFPLLAANKNPELTLRAFDYSAQAVKLVQSNPLYQSPPVGAIEAAVWDLSSNTLPPGVEPETVDIVVLVFVLSALHPDEWQQAIDNVHTILKPGGMVVLRDYGRYDLTQLRFKTGRLLDDNFYIRGDKTRVYFFELDELALLFTGSRASSAITTRTTKIIDEGDEQPQVTEEPGAVKFTSPEPEPEPGRVVVTPTIIDDDPFKDREPEHPSSTIIHPNLLLVEKQSSSPSSSSPSSPSSVPRFSIEQLGVDRRLIVNRKRQLKMYRVWMQGKFCKTR